MIFNKSAQERRRAPRVNHQIPIKIIQEDGDIVTETVNISRSGVYCQVNRALAPMSKLKVRLLLQLNHKDKWINKPVTCAGVVVRTEPAAKTNTYNVAIFFNDLSKKDSENIATYINACSLDNLEKSK